MNEQVQGLITQRPTLATRSTLQIVDILFALGQKCVSKRTGLSNQLQACHDLRRAFAKIVGKMHPGNPMWAGMIRRQLGHKHYAMTAHDTLLDADDIRDWIVSPLDRSAGGEVTL